MICPHCGKTLPEGQELKFCIFCGGPVPAPAAPAAPAEVPPRAAAPVREAPAPRKAPKVQKERQPRSHTGSVVVLALLLVLALGAAGFLGVCAYRQHGTISRLKAATADMDDLESGAETLEEHVAEQAEQLEEALAANEALTEQTAQLEDAAARLEADNAALEADIADLEDSVAAAAVQTLEYDMLLADCKSGRFGASSDKFFVDNAILVASLSKDERPELTLTTLWHGDFRVETAYSSDCAELEYQAYEWDDTVKLNLVPKAPGYTIVTFSNSLNKETFDVLLVVTE